MRSEVDDSIENRMLRVLYLKGLSGLPVPGVLVMTISRSSYSPSMVCSDGEWKSKESESQLIGVENLLEPSIDCHVFGPSLSLSSVI